jgi:hypothetical protein
MTPKFIPGAVYESTTHGLIEFKGVDTYMGQRTLHFVSLKYGNCYWLPDTLDMHFAPTQETPVARKCLKCEKPLPAHWSFSICNTCPQG